MKTPMLASVTSFLKAKVDDFKQLWQLVLVIMSLATWNAPTSPQKSTHPKTESVEAKVESNCNITEHVNSKAKGNQAPLNDLTVTPSKYEDVSLSLRSAFQAKDYQTVLTCWESLKAFDQVSTTQLCQVVEAMTRCKKDSKFIVAELRSFIEAFPSQQDMMVINDVFEFLARRFEYHLVDQIAAMLPSVNLFKDQRSFEVLLTMHVAKTNFVKAQRLLEEMNAAQVEATAKTSMAMLKLSLQTDNVAGAVHALGKIKGFWDSRDLWGVSPWAASQYKAKTMAQIVQLACKSHCLSQLLPELDGMEVGEEAVNMMLTECLSSQDLECASSLESIARANQAPLKDSTCALLIKCLASRPCRALPIVKEALWRESPEFSTELALAILDFCGNSSDRAMADRLHQQMNPKPWTVVVAFTDFYASSDYPEEACAILESHLECFHGEYLQHTLTGMINARTGWNVMIAALQNGRTALAQLMFQTSVSSAAKHVAKIQKWWKYGYESRRAKELIDVELVAEVGVRMSRVFQVASLEYSDDESPAPMFKPIAKSKLSHGGRSMSPDGSTSAGTASDSDEDSVGEWMTVAAWRPPPGLSDPLCPPSRLAMPDLPYPWESALVSAC